MADGKMSGSEAMLAVRAWCWVTVAIAGCGRLGFDPVDGADGGGFAVIDTLTVPVDGTSIASVAILASARTYRVRASGSFVTGGVGDMMGDAEYHDFSAPQDDNSLNGQDYGISLDSPVVGQKVTRWGTYSPGHVYEIDFAGLDQTVSANFHDGDYANNVGSLTLEILER